MFKNGPRHLSLAALFMLQRKHCLSSHPVQSFWLFTGWWRACKSSHSTKTSHVWKCKHLWFPSSLHLHVSWIALSNRTRNLHTKLFQFLYKMERHNLPSLMSLTGCILTPVTPAEAESLKAIYSLVFFLKVTILKQWCCSSYLPPPHQYNTAAWMWNGVIDSSFSSPVLWLVSQKVLLP